MGKGLRGSQDKGEDIPRFAKDRSKKYGEGGNPRTFGHDDLRSQTRSVFDRYNFVNDAVLQLASAKRSAYLEGQGKEPTGTIVNFLEKRANRDVG